MNSFLITAAAIGSFHHYRNTADGGADQIISAMPTTISSLPEVVTSASSEIPQLSAISSTTTDLDLHNPAWLMTFGQVTDGLLTNLVVVGGLIANGLTLAVLARPSMRTSTNSFLSALAIWDSVVLTCSAALIGLPGLPTSWTLTTAYRQNGPLAYAVSYIYPLALVAQTATIWLTVSFAVERFIGVHYPLKAVTLCTVQRARWVITAVCLASVAYNISRWFEYRPKEHTIVDEHSPNGTRRVIVVTMTTVGSNEAYKWVYFSMLYLPVMCIVPLAALTIINTSLFLAVRRSRADQKLMNVRQSRENNVTLVLVAVVAVFIVCQVPALVYNVAYAIDTNHVLRSPAYVALSHVRNLLVNINSAINFLLYCVFGQKFRRVFLMTFCRRFPNSVCGDGSGSGRSTGGGSGRSWTRVGNGSGRSAGGSGRSWTRVDNGSGRSTGVVSIVNAGCGAVTDGSENFGNFGNTILLEQRNSHARCSIETRDSAGDYEGRRCGSKDVRGSESTRRLMMQNGNGVSPRASRSGSGDSESRGALRGGRMIRCQLSDQTHHKQSVFI